MNKFQVLSYLLLFSLFYFASCSDDLNDSFTDDLYQEEEIYQSKRNCAVHEHMGDLLADPNFAQKYQERLDRFSKRNDAVREKAACSTPTIIPMAVHYQGVNSPNQSCLRELAQRQIDILNADYTGQNSDINKWASASSSFPGVSKGETCVLFVLANTNHPNGYSLQNGDPAVTINQTNGDTDNKWSGYLNIFVQFNTGLLGYSPYGGSGNGDGVVVDANAFGAGAGCGSVSPESPYNLGRTLTHEVGHYFLLDHIWGNGCNVDDEVTDTPDQSSDYGGCPNVGASSCGSVDMHMNYMDYTNDACMYMFSAGQSLRMENYIAANLNNIVSNASTVYNGSTDTEGGDNGGGDPEPEPEETCAKPSSSTVTVISNTKVKVNWGDSPNAIRYRIRYRESGTTRWSAVSPRVSQRTISNLKTTAVYEYQLRTRCPSGWTGWTAKKTFQISTPDTDNGGQTNTKYTLRLTLDDYASETTWYILDGAYNEIHKGGPYQDGKSGQKITKEFALSAGCYELELQDSYGDGICCDYGNGSAEILNAKGQRVAHLDGQFGTFDYVAFCVDGNGLRITKSNRDAKKLNRASKTKKF